MSRGTLGPVVGSLVFHAGCLFAFAQAPASGEPRTLPVATLPVELVPDPPPVARPAPEPEREAETASNRVARAPARAPWHRHPYPVSPNHDREPHDPNLQHAPVSTEGPAPAAASGPVAPEARPRFTLRGTSAGPFTMNSANGPAHGSGVSELAPTFTEGEVDEPARLRSTGSVDYPEAARNALIEADIPVEIVVDARGVVVSARALSHRGHGLERASVAAAQGYRFSPARRGGLPVRVRMRSTVSFRLR